MNSKTKSPGLTLPKYDDTQGELLMDIQELEVIFPGANGPVTVIDKLSISIRKGEILGLVGESGCGKSMLARAIMGLVPTPGKISAGQIVFEGENLLTIAEPEMQRIRGNRISIILQEPMTSLNPVFTIGDQMTEVLAKHRPDIKRADRRKHSIDMMARTGIQLPENRFDQYPHELSGGIRQRVMIAIALICGSLHLLVADEPTTALDATIQAQILELFIEIQAENRMALLLITHDLGVIAQTAHRVAVMYAGRLVEVADVETLFESPLHPYTHGLLKSLPRTGTRPRKSHMPVIPGTVPNIADLPPGCAFFGRCEHGVKEYCQDSVPQLDEVIRGHWVRCARWNELEPFELLPSIEEAS